MGRAREKRRIRAVEPAQTQTQVQPVFTVAEKEPAGEPALRALAAQPAGQGPEQEWFERFGQIDAQAYPCTGAHGHTSIMSSETWGRPPTCHKPSGPGSMRLSTTSLAAFVRA